MRASGFALLVVALVLGACAYQPPGAGLSDVTLHVEQERRR